MSANTARFAGLERRKGKIAEGFDADLIVFEPEKTFRVETQAVLHKNKVTPYAGQELHGLVRQTYVRGVKVFSEGEFPSPSSGTQILRS